MIDLMTTDTVKVLLWGNNEPEIEVEWLIENRLTIFRPGGANVLLVKAWIATRQKNYGQQVILL